MSGRYKLTYFPVTALAEPIRFLLAYSKIEFEDFRLERDQWPSIKPSTPFGKVPVLEIDGKQFHQCDAICRYLATEAGLAGSDARENLDIDIIVGTINDVRLQTAFYFYDPDETGKAVKYEPLINNTIPFYFEKLDAIVKNNGGYFVNGKLTWADLYFISTLDYMEVMANKTGLVENYENLKALKEKVLAIPQIADWVAKRPESQFDIMKAAVKF